MIYQPYHLETNRATLITNTQFFKVFTHLHRNFELLYVYQGEIDAEVDDTRYTLEAGDCLLVFPHQIHSYFSEVECRTTVIVFSEDLASAFAAHTESLLPVGNRVALPPAYFGHLEFQNIFAVKALLYKICGRMYAQTRFVRKGSKDGLIDRILRFVDENYQRDCSLQELSAQLSYDYYYLSKFFIRNTGISYHDFVNEYRVSSACNLLVDAERPIKDIARQCGFDSLRSFNRVFRQRRRITPSQYREKFADHFYMEVFR